MADHYELVAEMSALEQMGTQERQKLAKKRRLQQLKKWGQREKEWIAKEKQLNKRLANTLHEENNGLNLKQYTTYSSNHRSKKKLQLISANTNGKGNNNNNEFTNNNNESGARYRASGTTTNATAASTNGGVSIEASLVPNGRVHFNVGVMLLEAAARNDFDEVKRLLMLGVSPDSINHDGLTALHQCCIDASEPMMNLLLEFGASVDARDTEQWTPLHAACTCGHLNLVKILVENGANLLAVNGDGNMPFDICEDEATLDFIESQMVKRGITQEMIDFTRASTEMQMISDLEKMVAEGSDLNVANDNGVTPLHIAAANGYLSVVKFLLKHGVNVDAADNDLWRPIHGAACWGTEQHIKIVELLVEAGAQLDAKTISDESVFDLCDNAQLLERLNQLKDELESKQAPGTDRLRRTQSRTNSRVHSVRRTSVRDKNQISRREAREEALLRVDSTTNEATSTNGQSQTLEGSNVVNPGTNENLTTNEASPQQLQLSADQAHSSVACLDHVDGSTSTNESNNFQFKQTDLDEKLGGDDCEDDNIGSQTSNNQISIANHKNVTNLHQNEMTGSSTDSQNIDTETEIRTSTDRQLSLQGIQPANRVAALNNNVNASSSLINQEQATITNRDINSHITNMDTACDKNLSTQQIATATIQLVPVNYTLSNLKKQRSDLRMRTSSIGGVSQVAAISATSANMDTVNGVVNVDHTNQVFLEPQPTSLSINGIQQPSSPSLTFRKFRGEPSEVIGGRERVRRHKCCTLI